MGELYFLADQVQKLKPNWTIEECEEWLYQNWDRVEGPMLRKCWEILEVFLDLRHLQVKIEKE